MASNSKPFVSASPIPTSVEFIQQMNLSSSVPIRAPLTIDNSDSEFDLSSDATLSETASHSDLEAEEENEGEECFELDEELSVPLRVTPFAHLSTHDDEEEEYDDDEDEEDKEDDGEMSSSVRVPKNAVIAPRIKVLDVEEEISDSGSDASIDGYGIGIRVACDGDSTATEADSDVMSQCSKDGLENKQFGQVSVAFNDIENDDMELYGLDRDDEIRVELIETDNVMESNLEVENTETTGVVEETFNANNLLDSNAEGLLEFDVEGYVDSKMVEQNTSVGYLEQNPETGESLSDAFDENIEYFLEHCQESIEDDTTTIQSIATNGDQGDAASHQECESEKLISVTDYVDDSKDILHDSSVGFESNDGVSEGNEIQGVEYSELSDPALFEECTYLESGLSGTGSDVFCDYHSHENAETFNFGDSLNEEATLELNTVSQESKRDSSDLDEDVEELMSVRLEQFREQISALSTLLGSIGSGKNRHEEQTVTSPHGRMNLAKDDVRSQLIYFDSGVESDCNRVTVTYADQSDVLFLKGPASSSSLPGGDAQVWFQHNISENEKEKIHEIQTMSVEFLRLVQRINFSLEDSLVSRVLCRLVADIGRRSHQEFVISSAKILAKKLEEDLEDDLDFSLNILVLGKSGVGKSATINSIFGKTMVMTDAFEPATTSVREVSGTIDGVDIRILDTPGLKSPMKEQSFNKKILSSVKRYMKKFPPDVILYVDRVDIQTTGLNDLPILRSITSSLGPSIWQHTILALTHAASTPLDGPSGSPLSYEVFVAQKSYPVQQSIIKAVGDQCQLSPSFMCPVSLVENNPLCGKNISGDSVLPNGLRWRSQLLALCFSLKILSQVSSVSIPCTLFDHWKQFLLQDHSEPMCHLCSCLLQSPAHHLKFSANWS